MGGGEYPLLWGPALALNPSAEREVVWVVVVVWCGAYYLLAHWTMFGGWVAFLPFYILDHFRMIFFQVFSVLRCLA